MNSLLLLAMLPASIVFGQASEERPQPNQPLFQAPLLDAKGFPLVEAQVGGVQGKMRLILDTGNDSALLLDAGNARYLGLPLDVATINGNESVANRHAVSKLQLGRLILEDIAAYTTDLSQIRFVAGASIQGILGWDLLRRHVLSFDFDRGYTTLYSAPLKAPSSMDVVPLLLDEKSKLPCITMAIAGDQSRLVNIDTGLVATFRTNRETFRQWVAVGIVTSKGEDGSRSASVAGLNPNTTGVFNRGAILGIDLKGCEVDTDSRDLPLNLLGIEFLRRFNFILDGPNSKMHYQVRSQVQPTVNYTLVLGVRFGFTEGSCRVEALKPGGGPFEKAGFQVGDEILQLGPLATGQIDNQSAVELCLKHPGGPIPVRYRRAGAELETTVDVPAVRAE